MEIIPVLNKIDLPGSADSCLWGDRIKEEIEAIIGLDCSNCHAVILCSAKTGRCGVSANWKILPAVVRQAWWAA